MRARPLLRLSEKDQCVLSAIEHRARASVPELRKITGLREHVLRHHVHQLKARGVLVGRVPVIDPAAFGITEYVVYCVLSAMRKQHREKILQTLRDEARVMWLSEVGGDYHYGIEVGATHIAQAQSFLVAVSKKFGDPLHSKSFATMLRFSAFGRKYLGRLGGPILCYGANRPNVQLDAMDSLILKSISSGDYESLRALAGTLKISASTLERRVAALEEKRVIVGYLWRMNPNLLGIQRYKLQIILRGVIGNIADRLFAFCEKHPHIANLGEFLGAWDFELGVEISSPSELSELSRELFDRFGNEIESVKTIPVFSVHKFSTFAEGLSTQLPDRRHSLRG